MTYRGKGVLYGIGSIGTQGGLIISCSYQSSDWSGKVDEETITDCNGEVATHITKNPSETLALSYVYTAGTNTGAATLGTVAAGSILVLADADQADVVGNWLVTSVSEKRTNTSAAIVDLSCVRHSGITY